jgi:hypothetical protein
MLIGLNKTRQRHGRREMTRARERTKSYVLKQTYISVNDENAAVLKYFDLSTAETCSS